MNRLSIISLLMFALVACEKRTPCDLRGTWEVERLGCTGHPDERPAHVEASYLFEQGTGTTRWELPGCTVEAKFTFQTENTEFHIQEVEHICEATPLKEGEEATPCCTSAKTDLKLSYRCQLGPEGVDWMATLAKDGPVGPWAGRGAWRGCPEGSVGMMRLRKE